MTTKTANTTTVISLEPTLVAAGADAFPVIAAGDPAPDAGMLLTEAHLTNITQQLNASAEQLEQANILLGASNEEVARLTASITALGTDTKIAELEAQVTAITTERDVATSSNELNLATIESLTAENAALKAQIEEGSQPSGTGTKVIGAADENPEPAASEGKPAWYKPDFR